MRKINLNCIMSYIGEDYGGCTADDSFFETKETVEDCLFNCCFEDTFSHWPYIHDFPMLCK